MGIVESYNFDSICTVSLDTSTGLEMMICPQVLDD